MALKVIGLAAILLTTSATTFATPPFNKEAQNSPTPTSPATKPLDHAFGVLKLERVVMLMRHGIRPPTKAQPIPAGYTADAWPSWPVAPGLLTYRGAAGVTLLGAADRALYQQRGLIGGGCPKPGEIIVKASGKQRAIRTAQSWIEGFLPGCKISVSHPTEDGPDPIFHGLDDKPASFDGDAALRAAQGALPTGGLSAEVKAYSGEIALLARVLDCKAPTCPLFTDKDELVAVAHDRPELDGPLDLGSTASQSFLLEYLEGMPMKDVGWGRVTRPEIERLLRFHPLKFRYSNRPDYVARAAGSPLAAEVLGALTTGRARVTLLAGHDTNIADLGGFMRVHWAVPSYPADDVPPGGALGFELLRDAKGERFVRAFFRAQTMDQLRNQQPLTNKSPAQRSYLAIPGCGNSLAATACTLPAFEKLMTSRKSAGS